MKYSILAIPLAMVLAVPCIGSISGTYKGSFQQGQEDGTAFSFIHKSSSNPVSGDANYTQYAGGTVWFAMDYQDIFSFQFNDNDNNDDVSDGDTVQLDFTVDLFKFEGFSHDYSSETAVATLELSGTLTVGGSHSDNFPSGIRNITAGSNTAVGMDYEINKTSNDGAFDAGDILFGDAFFQSADYGGPFNGIEYNAATESINFAIWGDSRNNTDHSTGKLQRGDDIWVKSAGFDIFIKGDFDDEGDNQIPEPATILIWSGIGLAGIGGRYVRRKRKSTK